MCILRWPGDKSTRNFHNWVRKLGRLESKLIIKKSAKIFTKSSYERPKDKLGRLKNLERKKIQVKLIYSDKKVNMINIKRNR